MSDDPQERTIEQMLLPENWDETCRYVVGRMCDYVAPFVTPIAVSSTNENSGQQGGTGNYLELFGLKLLLSCEHVFERQRSEPLAYKLEGRVRFLRVEKSGGGASKPIDAAVRTVSQQAWEECAGRSKAIPIDRIATFHAPVKDELLFVRGYARANSLFVHDTLTTGATGYLTKEASLPQHADVSSRFHFALEYRRDAAVQAFGERGLPDPHAMSGSLVWNTAFVEACRAGRAWSPSYAKVTGLLWSWPDEHRIVSTRIEYVRSSCWNAWKRFPRRLTEEAASQRPRTSLHERKTPPGSPRTASSFSASTPRLRRPTAPSRARPLPGAARRPCRWRVASPRATPVPCPTTARRAPRGRLARGESAGGASPRRRMPPQQCPGWRHGRDGLLIAR